MVYTLCNIEFVSAIWFISHFLWYIYIFFLYRRKSRYRSRGGKLTPLPSAQTATVTRWTDTSPACISLPCGNRSYELMFLQHVTRRQQLANCAAISGFFFWCFIVRVVSLKKTVFKDQHLINVTAGLILYKSAISRNWKSFAVWGWK